MTAKAAACRSCPACRRRTAPTRSTTDGARTRRGRAFRAGRAPAAVHSRAGRRGTPARSSTSSAAEDFVWSDRSPATWTAYASAAPSADQRVENTRHGAHHAHTTMNSTLAIQVYADRSSSGGATRATQRLSRTREQAVMGGKERKQTATSMRHRSDQRCGFGSHSKPDCVAIHKPEQRADEHAGAAPGDRAVQRPGSRRLFGMKLAAYYRDMPPSGAPRVAITGIGVVSPFGVGRECSGVTSAAAAAPRAAITDFDASPFACTVAAPVPPVSIDDAIADRNVRRSARAQRTARSAPLLEGVADRRHRRERGVARRRPARRRARRRRARRQRRRRHRRRRAAVRRVLQRRLEARHALRDSRLHRRHGLERDLDRARTARHQPRRVDRLHELDRRDLVRGGADPQRRGRGRCCPAAPTPA